MFVIEFIKVEIMRFFLLLGLLSFSSLSNAQYHPKCDCSWQGGDKRQYGACEAEIEITPFKNSGSAIVDFFLEATVDTEKCTNVNYKLYENGSFKSHGMIHVRDGSNSENISGLGYSSTPQIKITDCVVCLDKRFGDLVDGTLQNEITNPLNGNWCGQSGYGVSVKANFYGNRVTSTYRGKTSITETGTIANQSIGSVIEFQTGNPRFLSTWTINDVSENKLQVTLDSRIPSSKNPTNRHRSSTLSLSRCD